MSLCIGAHFALLCRTLDPHSCKPHDQRSHLAFARQRLYSLCSLFLLRPVGMAHAFELLANAHNQVLQLLSQFAGIHFQGLSQGARDFKQF
eukprot:4313126-Amphidinium_carterae.1